MEHGSRVTDHDKTYRDHKLSRQNGIFVVIETKNGRILCSHPKMSGKTSRVTIGLHVHGKIKLKTHNIGVVTRDPCCIVDGLSRGLR
jgi:hypothetical protein